MRGKYLSVFLATLYFLRPTLGEFTDLVCEPSQRAISQFQESGCETSNISENILDGFAQFALVLEEQTPGHIFNFIETPRQIRTHSEPTRALLYNPPPPQFTGHGSHSNYGLQEGGLVWNGGSQVIGEVSVNLTGEFDMRGELEYPQQGFFVPVRPLGGDLTGIVHITGELAEPTKVRRFLKLVKRACLTYVPNFKIAKCPGQPISAAQDKIFVVNQPRLVWKEVVLYLLSGVSRNVPAGRVNIIVQPTIFVPAEVSAVRLPQHVLTPAVQYHRPYQHA